MEKYQKENIEKEIIKFFICPLGNLIIKYQLNIKNMQFIFFEKNE